ncbi:MAG: C39 family peptidase [Elusimicrobia bacterium]|nr:C39 family peptidase [Elusimicrobiota bacterium]
MRAGLALAAACALSACAGHRVGAGLPAGSLPVPLVRQATPYSCGAAAMSSVLRYWKVFDGGERSLYERLQTTEEDGTDPRSMVKVARELGLKAELAENLTVDDLRRHLAEGQTVILDVQAWADDDPTPGDYSDNWEDGHYVVLVGLDETKAYVMDPSIHGGYGWIPLDELPGRWHDYEDRDGTLWRYHGLGVAVSGADRLRSAPAPLERVR